MAFRFAIFVFLGAFGLGCSSNSDPSNPPDASGGGTGGSGGGGSLDPVLDGGGTIPEPPDGASLCPKGACNYQTGSGCSEADAGATCAPLPDGDGGVAPACIRAGSTAGGGACREWTDCAAGMVCAGGKCRKLCCGRDWTGCAAGEHCLRPFDVQLMASKIVASGAFLCFPVNTCDALAPASCQATEPGSTCQIADPTGATACMPEGTGTAGQPCPCQGGFTCVSNGCRRLCRAVAGGGEPSCPEAEGRCVHFNRHPAGVGECAPL